jgi:hypothetical protein
MLASLQGKVSGVRYQNLITPNVGYPLGVVDEGVAVALVVFVYDVVSGAFPVVDGVVVVPF